MPASFFCITIQFSIRMHYCLICFLFILLLRLQVARVSEDALISIVCTYCLIYIVHNLSLIGKWKWKMWQRLNRQFGLAMYIQPNLCPSHVQINKILSTQSENIWYIVGYNFWDTTFAYTKSILRVLNVSTWDKRIFYWK